MKRILALLISFFFTSLLLFSLLFIFSVREIHIEGVSKINEIHAYDYAFMPILSTKKVEKDLYIRNPSVKKIRAVKNYPNTLLLIVESSDPIAQIPLDKGFFLVNDAGRVVQKNTTDDSQLSKLAYINYYQKLYDQEYSVGDEIDKLDLRYAVAFLSKIKSLHIDIETIDITSPNMIVLINAQQRYLITIEKDIELQFQELKIVYERLLV
jgi:cell division septal protein FtsQ